jgi:putative NADH-flavin reductase
MAAVYHLGGKGEYKSWQWYESLSSFSRRNANHDRLFIVGGIISLPIAIAGFFVLPDVPEITKAWVSLRRGVCHICNLHSQKLISDAGKTIREAADGI